LSQISLGFVPKTMSLPIENILPTRKVPAGIIGSKKFQQIHASIEEVGLIEPLSISSKQKNSEHHLLLDGHVRLLALKELKYTEAPCLIANDDESYTYNKQVNRLSTIQEHFMIKRAIERGVSKERIAKALSIDLSSMTRKITLLDGICSEAADLLKDRQFSPHISRVVRKMKPTRQVECVELMVSANNVTVAYAEALLATTSEIMLVTGKKPKKLQGITQEQMARMEREMASINEQYKLAEEAYGKNVLNLMLARGFLVKMLENASVLKYLRQRRPEVLEQFHDIIAATSLEAATELAQPTMQ
jgi:hypothetical protein